MIRAIAAIVIASATMAGSVTADNHKHGCPAWVGIVCHEHTHRGRLYARCRATVTVDGMHVHLHGSGSR